jgi:DDE superfamily endonuclease
MQQDSVAETVRGWKADGVRALIWDNAPAHHAKLVRAAGPALVPLPPYSPELNPPERIFEEIRRRAEGRVWGTIDAKVAEVEAFLQDLAHHPERVRRLAGWAWITEARGRLPARSFPAFP